jgi:hypothetical protein
MIWKAAFPISSKLVKPNLQALNPKFVAGWIGFYLYQELNRSMKFACIFLILAGIFSCSRPEEPLKGVEGGRFFTFNTVVRVNQIEVSRDRSVGEDEKERQTLKNVQAFRKAVYDGWPEAKITWAFSWLSLHSMEPNYVAIRKYVKQCHEKYGDDVTFIPGAFFANAYNSRVMTNRLESHRNLRVIGV